MRRSAVRSSWKKSCSGPSTALAAVDAVIRIRIDDRMLVDTEASDAVGGDVELVAQDGRRAATAPTRRLSNGAGTRPYLRQADAGRG